jgi:hypothetical protein
MRTFIGCVLFMTACLSASVPATIQVSAVTPPVDPNGKAETVGALRFVFDSPEFGDAANPSAEAYYVLIRVWLTEGVELRKIGGRTSQEISPSNYIGIALERNSGTPLFNTADGGAVRLIRFGTNYFDLLFTKNMYNPGWVLSTADTVRITVGLPGSTVPSDPQNNLGGLTGIGKQPNTQLECDFSGSKADFSRSAFWEVGFTVHRASSGGKLMVPYNSCLFPPRIALAHAGRLLP